MAMTALAEDPQLIAAWRDGDQAAATMLVHRHGRLLGRYLLSRGAPPSDVEDLLQETFFRAFQHVESWRGEGTFRGWLFRIAGNLLKDSHRRGGGRHFVELSDSDRIDLADPESDLAADETADRIQSELARLPRLQREVFCLRVEQGLGDADIATALDTTPGAARVHYHHAVRRLKEAAS
ncbi:MAG: RNA polymerase subunit sigma-24 [Gemmatimonadetes bacterium HGW-Gemmatimonadetes-1]|nr:MAG: RNA polymerase subunit sigma-24 [Gemmatimonadetes bacterium HGW-Gemmatimonadetes-1]